MTMRTTLITLQKTTCIATACIAALLATSCDLSPEAGALRDAAASETSDAAGDLVGNFGIVTFGQPSPTGGLGAFVDVDFEQVTGGACRHRRAIDGPCRVTACASARTLSPVSAGKITLAGGAPRLLSLDPGVKNRYPSFTDSAPHWADGDPVSVEAVGATVPAFRINLVFPPPITVTDPVAPPGGEKATINHAGGFTARWTGDRGTVRVRITSTSGTHVAIDCRYDARALTGTVPPTALSDLSFADTGAQVHVDVESVAIADAVADLPDEYSLEVAAIVGALSFDAIVR